MSQMNIGPTRARARVSVITTSGMLFLAIALRVALPGSVTSTGASPSEPANSVMSVNLAASSDLCWQVVSAPNPDATGYVLSGVTAVSANDVWAVGGYATGSIAQTLIEHWNGTAWRVVASPNQGTSSSSLSAVDAVSANDIWAVGTVRVDSTVRTLVEHWNGTGWSVVPSPNVGTGSNYFFSVAAVTASDVWAVGSYYNTSSTTAQTLVEHWNGTAWTVVPSPNPSATSSQLSGVAAVSADNAWAVGSYNKGGPTQTLIEQWNGTAWSIVPSADQSTSDNQSTTSNYLLAVAAVSANDVWAVGYFVPPTGSSMPQTLVEHWNGSSWTVVPSPNPSSYISQLVGVGAVSANDVWAVGNYNSGSGSEPGHTLVEHWNGTAWSVVTSPDQGDTTNDLLGVAAVSAADVRAVGYSASGGYPLTDDRYQALVEHLGPCPQGSATTATPTTAPPPTLAPATPPATRHEPLPPPVALPGTESRTYPQTGQTVSGVFLTYWDTHGGLAQQGYPISAVIGEISELDGKPYTVQYFERAVFEYHPENQPPNDVLLSQLGTFRYQEKYPQGAPGQVPNTSESSVRFTETGKQLGGKFLEYWKGHGGLAQQGYPISDEFMEKSETDGKEYLVQYFERSVMELHPENQPPNDVLLSLLGAMQYTAKYGIKTQP